MEIKRFEAAGLKCLEVAPGRAGTGSELPLVIGLHGRGDWGENYVDLAPLISETAYRFLFPTGPLPLPGALFEWFRLESGNIAKEVVSARQLLFKLLAELSARYSLPASRIFLFGFSQGGMMALDTGLRYRQATGERLPGVASLSGLLLADAPIEESLRANPGRYYTEDRGDLKEVLAGAAAAKIPVFIAHGSYDPVVPVLAGQATRDHLRQAGLKVEYLEFQGGHQITFPEIQALSRFIESCIPKD